MAKIFNPVKQWAVFNKYVKLAMVNNDIETHEQLAAALSMTRCCVSKRLKYGGWTVEETWRLIRTLKIPPESVAVMMASVAA